MDALEILEAIFVQDADADDNEKEGQRPLGIDLGLPKGRCWHGPNYYFSTFYTLNTLRA